MNLLEFNVRRLDGDELEAFGNAHVYEIVDEETLEGVFYLIADPDDQSLTLTSVDIDGVSNDVDVLLLTSRVSVPPDESDDQSQAVWKGNFQTVLQDLLGNHARIVIDDLKGIASAEPDAPRTEGRRNRSLATNDLRNVTAPMKFDFDPGLDLMRDLSGQSDTGDIQNDVDVNLPPSIDPEGDPPELPDGSDLPADGDDGDGSDDDEDAPTSSAAQVQVTS